MIRTGPRIRRRAVVAMVTLLGVVLALLPASPAAATPSITVTGPAISTTWTVGSTRTITWATDVTGPVQIDLLNEPGGTVATAISAGVSASAGKFNWQIPATSTSGTFRIRVQSVNTPAITDTSNGIVTLALPTVAVTAPSASDTWVHGTTKSIKWTTAFTGKVEIDLMDGGSHVADIKDNVAASSKQFSWNIPVGIATNGAYQVRVQSMDNAAITAVSASFNLNRPTPTVTAPAAAATWGSGTTQLIRWTLPVPGNAKIDLLDDNDVFVSNIKATVAAKSGSYRWQVPATATAGQYKIRVQHLTDPAVTASSGVFNIALGTLTVTSPVVSDNWLMGTTKVVRWTTSIGGNLKAELVDGSNAVVLTPKASVSATAKQFSWAIPLTIATGGSYTIRLTSLANGAIIANSASFTVTKPTITVNTPADVALGNTRQLTWSTTLASGNVRIEADPTGAGSNILLKTMPAKSGLFNWTVPAGFTPGEYNLVVTSSTTNLITDTSAAPFDVTTPVLEADTPGGTWTAGTTQAVTWDAPVNGNVKLELVGGGTTKLIRSSVAASAGTFSWAIPLNIATAGGTFAIKVTWLSNTSITDTSGTFTLDFPVLTVTVASATPTTFNDGTPQNITWSGLTSGNVRVQLIRTSGSGPATITVRSSIAASLGTVSYTFPANTVGSEYRVRVTSLVNANLTDDSTSVIQVT